MYGDRSAYCCIFIVALHMVYYSHAVVLREHAESMQAFCMSCPVPVRPVPVRTVYFMSECHIHMHTRTCDVQA